MKQLESSSSVDHNDNDVLVVVDHPPAIDQSVSSAAESSSTSLDVEMLTPTSTESTATKSDERLCNALSSIRHTLLRERNSRSANGVTEAHLIKELVAYLTYDHQPFVLSKAVRALADIAYSGTSTQMRHVVEAGAIPAFVRLLSSPLVDTNVVVQALGDIAFDEWRDLLIECGAVESLLVAFEHACNDTSKANILRTLDNLYRCKKPPQPSPPSLISMMERIFTMLVQHRLLYSDNVDVLSQTCWLLANLSSIELNNDTCILGAVVKSGLVPRLVELLNAHYKTELRITRAALRCIGNICTGTDAQTQIVIDAHLLPVLRHLLAHDEPDVQKEAAWTLSNICAGTHAQIQALVQSELVVQLVQVLKRQVLKPSVLLEVTWAIFNYTCHADATQMAHLIECDVIKPICKLLAADDVQLGHELLGALYRILHVASTRHDSFEGVLDKAGDRRPRQA